MKRGQLLTIGIAGVAALGAMIAALNLAKPTAPIVETRERTINTVPVLVAKNPIGLGDQISRESLRWQQWPTEALSPAFITERGRPQAMSQMTSYVARQPIMANEPITEGKVVKPEGGGVLAAILQPGMRAISTRIKEETGVGRLILPNDHVDVILTQRRRSRGGEETIMSDVLFRNVRILAIGQMIEVKVEQPRSGNAPNNPNSTGNLGGGGNGTSRQSVEGNTATLELSPKQSEILALANAMGEISLALRSVADIKVTGEGGSPLQRQQQNGIRVIKYGSRSRASGVQ